MAGQGVGRPPPRFVLILLVGAAFAVLGAGFQVLSGQPARIPPLLWVGLALFAPACLLLLWAVARGSRRPGQAPPREARDLLPTEVIGGVEAGERLRRIFHSLPGVIFQHRLRSDGRGSFPYASEAAQDLCGASPQELARSDAAFFAALHSDDVAQVRLSRGESAATLRDWHCEARLCRPDGREIWIELRGAPEREGEEATLWYGFVAEVTGRKQVEAELRRLATSDALTGLHNRGHFLERAKQELRRARRHGRSLVVVMLDLDYFKAVNDRYGHEAGDAVLRDVAARIGGALRVGDVVGRLGGEEFAVLLPETTTEQALAVAERLRARVADVPLGPGLGVTASIGVAVVEPAEENLDAALKRADTALYRAKAMGRNQVVLEAAPASAPPVAAPTLASQLTSAPTPARSAPTALVSSLPQPISRYGG